MLLFKKLDGWSLTHLLWPYGLVLTMVELGVGSLKAAWIAIVLAAIWELLDEINKKYNLRWWWLDPAGFSLTDFLYGIIGAIGAFMLVLFF